MKSLTCNQNKINPIRPDIANIQNVSEKQQVFGLTIRYILI